MSTPDVKKDIMAAIGAEKGSPAAAGQAKQHILQCRKLVAALLRADLDDDTDLTELCCPLIEAWALAAGDADTPLLRWLRHGAPAGIEVDIDKAGIFPRLTPRQIESSI